MKDGVKIYKAKHYLLNSLREIVSLYNEEHADEKPTTYYQVRDIVEMEKHLILQDKKPDDDCRCEVCENAELLLDAAKTYLKKNEKNEIAPCNTNRNFGVKCLLCQKPRVYVW